MTKKKARQEAKVLPEKILARKMAQRGLSHSVPPTGNGGGWRRNSERWPATPGPEGKGGKDKGKGKKGKDGKTKGKTGGDSSRGPSDRKGKETPAAPGYVPDMKPEENICWNHMSGLLNNNDKWPYKGYCSLYGKMCRFKHFAQHPDVDWALKLTVPMLQQKPRPKNSPQKIYPAIGGGGVGKQRATPAPKAKAKAKARASSAPPGGQKEQRLLELRKSRTRSSRLPCQSVKSSNASHSGHGMLQLWQVRTLCRGLSSAKATKGRQTR